VNNTISNPNKKRLTKALGVGLSALIGLASVLPASLAAPSAGTAPTQKYARQQSKVPASIDRRDLLLVMPNTGAEGEDIQKVLEETHGTIIGRMGSGEMTILVIQAEHGKAVELQKKLVRDKKDFKAVDVNTVSACDYAPSPAPSKFSDSWHLFRMHITDAWDTLIAHHAPFAYPIAILDSGLQSADVSFSAHGADCTGKPAIDALKLYDKLNGHGGFLGTGLFASHSVDDNLDDIQHVGNYIETLTYGLGDSNGHGTWVASVATASMYHTNGSIGVNPYTSVFPIRIANGGPGKIYTDEIAEVEAFMVLSQKQGTRIVNISYGNVYDSSKEVFNKLMQYYHDKQGGLIFCSAGNSGQVLTNENKAYLIVVSAMEKVDLKDPTQANKIILANKATNKSFDSNYGTPVDFTAPGSVIDTQNTDGSSATVYGTSFSSPICAAVASMVWTVNPKLTNDQVEGILRASCENTTSGWNSQFGWGMPNADKAVKMALGG
jgi:subtilisin family serine protease